MLPGRAEFPAALEWALRADTDPAQRARPVDSPPLLRNAEPE